jgi:hypothetical protein
MGQGQFELTHIPEPWQQNNCAWAGCAQNGKASKAVHKIRRMKHILGCGEGIG